MMENQLCRWCKKACGSPCGGFKNPRNSGLIRIPFNHQLPQMPYMPVDGQVPEPSTALFRKSTLSTVLPGMPTGNPPGRGSRYRDQHW